MKAKITKIAIENYRSIQNVTINNIGNMLILIGKNGSGKSNILEALMHISSTNLNIPSENQEYLWYLRDTGNPIKIGVELNLSKGDYDNIVKKLEEIPPLKNRDFKFEDDSDTNKIFLEIKMKMTNNQPEKIFSLFKIGDFVLFKDNKVNTKVFEQFFGKKDGQKFNQNEQNEMDVHIKELFGKLMDSLNYHYFPITRFYYNINPPWDRKSSIPDSQKTEIIKIGASLKKSDERTWNKKLTKYLQQITGKNIVIRGNIIIFEEDFPDGKENFPDNTVGGGDQAILSLVTEIAIKKGIFGIDEPELHLHPGMARSLFDFLKEVAKQNQFIISTHSPIFLDKTDFSNIKIIKFEENKTIVRDTEEKNLKEITFELGIKPSDILFSNGILFVEGPSDEQFLRHIIHKIDTKRYDFSIIPTRGKNKSKYHLEMRHKITTNVDVSYLMLLDKNAEKEKEEVIKKRIIDKENIRIWSKGNIEDYYPSDLIFSALSDLYDIELNDEEKDWIKDGGNVAKSLDKIFKSHDIDCLYRTKLADYVGENMTSNQIDREIKDNINWIIKKFK